MERKFSTPKFDSLLGYLKEQADKGKISFDLMSLLSLKLQEAVYEIRDLSLNIAHAGVNRVGWYGFTIGLAVGCSLSVLITMYFFK